MATRHHGSRGIGGKTATVIGGMGQDKQTGSASGKAVGKAMTMGAPGPEMRRKAKAMQREAKAKAMQREAKAKAKEKRELLRVLPRSLALKELLKVLPRRLKDLLKVLPRRRFTVTRAHRGPKAILTLRRCIATSLGS